ncbi:alpha/beta fold hydrolase [Nocardia sp. CDC159]|uniref:Alpha/beta fold hydrolase n=1 Tax=Nocardia pulmonis TaxID=2951408 RepID=A0A9X2IWS4_9NOCA|nr:MULTISPECIES: alpha/beta fold hydrolase [Nocardia]MCM6773080.1 alpha/beta fold hydrolase [Nocardia pulmonis]MCM6785617.1 alpha/beta fold hydrolase [Nocardia sp. CDC159]
MLISANGIRLKVEVAGDGVPIIFLHAGSMTGAMWRPQFEYFATDYRCLAWDARGHGDSEVTLGEYRYPVFARDLFDVMDHFGMDTAHLVGLSMGGIIAMQYACDYPHRVKSLALLSTTARARDVPSAFVELVEEATGNGHIPDALGEDVLREELRNTLSPHTIRSRPEVFEEVCRMHADHDPRVLTRLLPAFQALDLTDRIRQLKPPTTVLCGADDTTTTPLAAHRHIVETIPGAELHIVPDAGHLVNMENPTFVNSVLAQHFGNA